MRPLTRSRPEPAAAGHPHSGPRRAGPGQSRHADPGEHITMPVIRGRILRVAMRVAAIVEAFLTAGNRSATASRS